MFVAGLSLKICILTIIIIKKLRWPIIINDKIIAKDLHGETVLLNRENGDYFTLNNMGTEIYNCICNGMETGEIIDLLFGKYNIEYAKLKTDIISLIDEMNEKNILTEE